MIYFLTMLAVPVAVVVGVLAGRYASLRKEQEAFLKLSTDHFRDLTLLIEHTQDANRAERELMRQALRPKVEPKVEFYPKELPPEPVVESPEPKERTMDGDDGDLYVLDLIGEDEQ